MEMRIRRPCIFFISVLLFQHPVSEAVNLEFSSIKFEEGEIALKMVLSDSLPGDLVNYIKKGVPISFEYKTELWKSRPGWLDKHVENCGVIYRLRYDTWEKEYTIITRQSDLTIEHHLEKDREALDLVKTSGLLKIRINDTSGQFYITGKLTINKMSLSNLKEVESWLKGGISGARKPEIENAPDKFGEFLFNTALKISGIKNISEEVRTPFFKIDNGKIVFLEAD